MNNVFGSNMMKMDDMFDAVQNISGDKFICTMTDNII